MILPKNVNFSPKMLKSGFSKWPQTGRSYFHDFSKKNVNFSRKISKAAFQNGRQQARHIFMIFHKNV
jgi:hypothetical protein